MAHGKEYQAAFIKAATWGTAVTCGAGDGLKLKTGGIAGGARAIEDETASGNLWGDPVRSGPKEFRFPATIEGRYLGLEQLVAVALGTTGSTPTLLETGVYQHNITPTTGSLPFGSWVEKRGDVAVWEMDSVKVNRLTIRGTRGDPLEVEAEMIGRSLAYGTGVNTTATYASVTIPSGELPFFSQGRFRMNAQGGATLATNIEIESFEITIDNGLDEESFRADGTNALVIAEPDRGTAPRVSGRFQIDEYDANTYRALRDAHTAQKMEMIWTGSTLIGATQYPYFRIQCPYVQLTEDDAPMPGPDRVPEPIAFVAFPASAAPTGMTVTTACQIRIQSAEANDPLTGNAGA